MRARGLGARVVVTEVDPLKALEAVMDGFQVLPILEAARIGDFFVTVTGNIQVIGKEHLEVMKDGAILANSGHFNVEIDLESLKEMSNENRILRDCLQEFTVNNGKKLYLLGEGRLINLTAAEGHPSSVMDMSFANQALSAEYLVKNGRELRNQVYSVPEEIDREIARLKLESMGIKLDQLTPRQQQYLQSWDQGT